jgi:2-keto-4-pentenoate hydratase/2-oxohepta-3-ene-1,7-dioic acid hydratase in catechol pathway
MDYHGYVLHPLLVDGHKALIVEPRKPLSDLIFKIPALIEHISSLTPLQPGDVISTGTPEGVGLGRTPQRWLQPGDEMVITIQKLGSLRNRTVAERTR